MYDRGTVVVVPFPYTDLRGKKTRPALVLSDRIHNDLTGDIVLCALTSNLVNSRWSVLVEQGDMESGKLPLPSRVKVDKLITLHRTVIRKQVGRLDADAMARVWKEFQTLFPARG